MTQNYIERKIKLYKLKKKIILESGLEIKNVNFHKNIHPFLAMLLSIKR